MDPNGSFDISRHPGVTLHVEPRALMLQMGEFADNANLSGKWNAALSEMIGLQADAVQIFGSDDLATHRQPRAARAGERDSERCVRFADAPAARARGDAGGVGEEAAIGEGPLASPFVIVMAMTAARDGYMTRRRCLMRSISLSSPLSTSSTVVQYSGSSSSLSAAGPSANVAAMLVLCSLHSAMIWLISGDTWSS